MIRKLVHRQDIEGLEKAFQQGEVDVAVSLESGGWTGLLIASSKGYLPIVELFMKNGADINQGDLRNENTPLHWAAGHGHLEVCQYLIENCANIALVNESGLTPLHLACGSGKDDVVEYLVDVIESRGQDVDTFSEEQIMTPLINAAFWGRRQISDYLIHHGADVFAKARETPLGYACIQERGTTAQLLISWGADINEKNSAGYSAAEWAKFSLENAHNVKTGLAMRKRRREQYRQLLLGVDAMHVADLWAVVSAFIC